MDMDKFQIVGKCRFVVPFRRQSWAGSAEKQVRTVAIANPSSSAFTYISSKYSCTYRKSILDSRLSKMLAARSFAFPARQHCLHAARSWAPTSVQVSTLLQHSPRLGSEIAC